MGPGIVLFIWILIATILGAVCLAVLILFLIARKKKWKILKWLSGGVVAGILILGIFAVVIVTYGLVRSSIPKYVFIDVFHNPPGDNIRALKSKVFSFADTRSIYLRFETDPATFRKLVPKDLPKVTREEFEARQWHESVQHPPWWQPSFASSDEIYFESRDFGKGKEFASEMTLMTYDSQRQIAYYRFLGID